MKISRKGRESKKIPVPKALEKTSGDNDSETK
jgi:hypothetical protein